MRVYISIYFFSSTFVICLAFISFSNLPSQEGLIVPTTLKKNFAKLCQFITFIVLASLLIVSFMGSFLFLFLRFLFWFTP